MRSRFIRRLLATSFVVPVAAAMAAPSTSTSEAALSHYSGQVVYVDFWASWCVPCARSFPWLNTLQSRYGDRLKVVAVNVDENRADAEHFLVIHPASFPVIFDPAGKLAEHYHVEGMPSAVILGRDGRVLHQHAGFREADIGRYESEVASALDGTSPSGGAP